MKNTSIALATAAAVLVGVLTPLAAASAADVAVTGTVTLDGVAAPAVEVGWFDAATNTSGETVTAANGGYTLPVPAGHSYVLYAGIDHSAKGWTSVGASTYVGVFQGPAKTDYLYQGLATFPADVANTSPNIDLDKPGSLSGTLAALKGEDISLLSAGGEILDDTKADANGSFAFDGLIPGRYTVGAYAYNSDYSNGGVQYTSPIVTVSAGAVTNAVPAASVTGSVSGVVTNKGEPVKGVYVHIANSPVSDTTDSKGRYTLTQVPLGRTEVEFDNSRSDDTPYPMNTKFVGKTVTVDVTANATATKNVALARGSKVSGSAVLTKNADQGYVNVVDSKGRLVAGELINAKKKGGSISFSFSGLPSGKYTVYVSDITKARFASKTFTARNSSVKVGALKLTRKTVTITGRVAGDAKYVYFSQAKRYPNGASVKKGTYSITGVIPGAGTLSTDSTRTQLETATKITVTPTKHSKNLKAGVKLATVAGTFSAGGVLIPGGGLIATAAGSPFGYYLTVENGAVTRKVIPGTVALTWENDNDTAHAFATGSPFWLEVPADKASATFAPGGTTDLGAVALTVSR